MLCLPRGFQLPLFLMMVGSLLIGTCATAFAEEAETVIELKSGETVRGQLVSQDTETLVLNVDGENRTVALTDIRVTRTLDTVEAKYKDRRDKLANDDLQGRYDLARWLFDNKAYTLANSELVDLRRRFPDDQRVELLMKVVQERMKLKPGAADESGEEAPAPGDEAAETLEPGEIKKLSDEQINLIKVWELPPNFAKERMMVIVPRDTMQQVIEKYSDNPALPKGRADRQKLLRSPGYEQLELMFRLRAREYYKDVIVRQEPPVLMTYRQQLNARYVLPYFLQYFGKGQIPGLVLIDGRTEQDIYTNFFILQDFFYGGQAMINRLEPEKSLLLQWGLERSEADFPAPDVPGWQPRFRTKNDPNFKRYLDWIDALNKNPDYRIPRIVPAKPDKPGDSDSDKDQAAS